MTSIEHISQAYKHRKDHRLLMPDSSIQLKARGYSIWSTISHRTPYMKIIFEGLQDYSSKSTTQPQCNQGSTRKVHSRRSSRDSKTASEVLRSLQYSTMKSSGVCQIRDHGMPKYGTGHVLPRCHIKYSCTIRTSQHRWKLFE